MTFEDLSGSYKVFLDKDKKEDIPAAFSYEINLPNTLSAAGIGEINSEKNLGFLTDLYKFEGYAWYCRKINITSAMTENTLMLFMERTRKTAVYVDRKKIGEYCFLCAPHRYFLKGIAPGEHELIIRVDNTNYPTGGGHLTSPDTQTNWNGITGEIGLYAFKSMPYGISTQWHDNSGKLKIKGKIYGDGSTVQIKISDDKTVYGSASCEIKNSAFCCEISLEKTAPLWDEFNPSLLDMKISVGQDERTFKVGLREFKAQGLKIKVNGNETFLRGKHDGLVFPKTGYAPTDLNSWLKVFEITKSYGINHYRFHTCCPPEAAFEAADIMGIYLQPELPFWGTVPDSPTAETEFLRQEGFRLLEEFGSHPSFAMMTMGNELWGSKEMINTLVGEYKAEFPDKLYGGGSNNFQFMPDILPNEDFFSGVRLSKNRLIRGSYALCDAPLGFVQTEAPGSSHNYDEIIEGKTENSESGQSGEILIQQGTEAKKVTAEEGTSAFIPNTPIITHEIGQYAIYPDYKEIDLYKGSLKHTPYESYRDRAREKGLLPYSEQFFKASGKLAADCYKRDIEAAMTSEKLAGFQILDLQDFPGQGIATVGILNAFLENKGLISPEEWQGFCSAASAYARLPKFLYQSGEEISFDIVLSSTLPNYAPKNAFWRITGDNILLEGKASVVIHKGRIFTTEKTALKINSDKPQKLTMTVWGEKTGENKYSLYIYPDIDVKITEKGISYGDKFLPIVHSIEELSDKNLCIPYPKEGDLKGEYCTDFWCWGMFKSISESMGKAVAAGTLGLLIDENSPLLKGFPCDLYTTPQWYEIVTHSFPFNLEGAETVPQIWVIDNPERAKRLGLLFKEKNGVICTSRLWEIKDCIEVKHFAASLVKGILG